MWDAFLDAIFACIQFFYSLCGDWGLAIIFITLIFRAVLSPLMYAQSKSTLMMQKVQPKIKQIQERFSDDPARMNQETQKLYAEAKFNPLSSCIPMIIQIPIFFALFRVLNGMAGTNLAEGDKGLLRFHDTVVSLTGGGPITFLNIIPDLTQTTANVWQSGFEIAFPYVFLLLVFAFCTFVPMLLNLQNQSGQQKKTMIIMTMAMSVMMLFFGWTAPAGVLLFWGVSSILAIIQQQGSLYLIKKKEKETGEDEIVVPVDIEVDRRPTKKRQRKKH